MRAYRHTAFTGPDGLTLVDEPVPEPGPGQVLIRIKATALNYRDIAIAAGTVPWPQEVGRIALSDAAGEVEAIGPGVTRVAPGDAVTSTFSPTWFGGPLRDIGSLYGVQLDGWLADYIVVSQEAVVRAPRHLSFEEAATIPCAALTAWSALAGVQPGDTVLTQGSGGVSLFAIQLARAKGAHVIATTSSPAKAERLRALGADSTIDYAAEPQWADHVRRLAGGRGADRVVEIGGGAAIAESVKAVAVGGQISLVGLLAPSETGLSVTDLFLSQATIRPISVGSRDDLEALGRAMEAWELRPVIDRVYDFDDARAAFSSYGRPDQFGKLVIRH